MKKRKIVSLVAIAALSVGMLSIPAMAEELQDVTSVQEQIQEIKSNTTTGAAVKIKDILIPEDLKTENIQVTKLEAEIQGDASIGNKITAKVKGYNAENEEIELNEKDINYKWIAKDKIEDTEKIVGTEKKLEITDDMTKLEIHCNVSYENK